MASPARDLVVERAAREPEARGARGARSTLSVSPAAGSAAAPRKTPSVTTTPASAASVSVARARSSVAPRLDEVRADGQRRGAPRDDRRASDGPEVELGVDDAHCAPLEHDDRAALRVRVEHPERRARGDALAPPHLREAPPGHVVAEAAAA